MVLGCPHEIALKGLLVFGEVLVVPEAEVVGEREFRVGDAADEFVEASQVLHYYFKMIAYKIYKSGRDVGIG